MQDPNLPDIDLDQLMETMRQAIAERRKQSLVRSIEASYPGIAVNGDVSARAQSQQGRQADAVSTLDTYRLVQAQGFLGNAESRAHDRTKWPDKLQKFPFTLSKKFQRLLLKLQNSLLMDQRIVNLNLIQSVQSLIEHNQQLTTEVMDLRAELMALKLEVQADPSLTPSGMHRSDEPG
ncbi:MAG: hypothetical protein VKJ24_00660 [Synechococcales bacterium]|nr:hypothetical protein [Synechococcales bacterium]